MVRRYFIVVGDTTTAGGKVLTGAPSVMIQSLSGDQRPQAFTGDRVLCGQCGPTTISSGVPQVTFDGREAVVEGGDLACGHKLVSTEQRLSWIEDETACSGGQRFSSPAASAPAPTASPMAAGSYDEAFILRSQGTGRPLANRRYRIVRGDSVEEGITDAHGKTHVVASDRVEGVVIHLQEEGP